mgnify:CR=1 FL=1
MLTKHYGWECPKCGMIHAPWVPDCGCHKPATAVSPHFMVCLQCNTTYAMGQPHYCNKRGE